jgi:hypothetical protein
MTGGGVAGGTADLVFGQVIYSDGGGVGGGVSGFEFGKVVSTDGGGIGGGIADVSFSLGPQAIVFQPDGGGVGGGEAPLSFGLIVLADGGGVGGGIAENSLDVEEETGGVAPIYTYNFRKQQERERLLRDDDDWLNLTAAAMKVLN